MTTKISGRSDDLIEFEGDVEGEVGHHERDDDTYPGSLVMCSDGTVLSVKYGKPGKGIWELKLLERGALFERIDIKTEEDDEGYSDVAHFRDGLKWAYAASAGHWERVK